MMFLAPIVFFHSVMFALYTLHIVYLRTMVRHNLWHPEHHIRGDTHTREREGRGGGGGGGMGGREGGGDRES